ncbi:MAG TPA: signal recognition particle-docking protein FtsY [Candidimonas sp.]|nr:signal recognition particle-docking protein FtsY [Candidimonas sp.]
MFSFFKRKKPSTAETSEQGVVSPAEQEAVSGLENEAAPQDASESSPQGLVDQAPVDAVDPQEVKAAEPAPTLPDSTQSSPVGTPETAAPTNLAVEPETPTPVAEPQIDSNASIEDVPAEVPVAASPVIPAQVQQEPAPVEKGSWLSRLKKGLSRTGQSIGGLFVGVKVDEALFEDLETALIMADAGVEATEKLLVALRARVRKERLAEGAQVKAALRDILAEHLTPLEKQFPLDKASPLVIMIAGVNGAGKTTSIGKLANAFQAQGASVLLAAGDTFRAAAREQLMEWGARNNVTVIAQDGGDPAAVAFDAVNAGRAREANVVMVDTAGRLPTQLHLMEELKKIKRVIGKADGAAPHEVLLVIDGNTGQNALAQIRAFDAAINLTGLVVTKLDGTAKGGTLAAVAAGSQGVRPIPVYWIGVGEGLNDLQPFVAREFAAAVIGD